MLPAEALAIWSQVCASADIGWALYKDTLLCAAGYKAFPGTLKCPQVAVFAADWAGVMNTVIPGLPEAWQPDYESFASQKTALVIRDETSPVLEIHILFPLENPEQVETYLAKMRKIREGVHSKNKLLSIINKCFGGRFENAVKKTRAATAARAVDRLIALVQRETAAALYYSDTLTEKPGSVYPKALMENMEWLTCDETAYPVFSGYRALLAEAYGDYETGLFDDIGCGLTAEEKAALKAHQLRCREALAFLQTLSEEYSLRYSLLAGSVLGCVRHKGFVPWDDDIDIGIRIEDLTRFEQIVKEQLPLRLPAGFHLMQSGPNNPYPRMFSKICYEGRCCMDLWPLIPTYTEGLQAEFTWYFAKLITKAHYKKIGQEPTRFVKLVNLMCFFLSDRMIMWSARWNERKYRNRNAPAYINLYSIYRREKETILRCWLDQEAWGDFDGLRVPIVGHTEEYLAHMYGDYMEKPAPWKRASRHVARFGVENGQEF